VLKHTVLIAVLRHLTEKEAPLAAFDTHAGAGLYRLDGDYALTSGEAAEGFLRLLAARTEQETVAPAVQDYLDLVQTFNNAKSHRIYPGSPFIIQHLLRPRDKLKLFELHPTDARTLLANIAQLEAGRQVAVLREDGFEGLKKFLPPPQRRALVLIDPSYELKSDYARVVGAMGDALARFATGTYLVWYPIIPRPEAHDLPRKLKALARKAGRSWLHATLAAPPRRDPSPSSDRARPGLRASGVVVLNPPHTLHAALAAALPQLCASLGDKPGSFTLDVA
jgi:23S rRNA (adenine2030-N6)-methyltransferase